MRTSSRLFLIVTLVFILSAGTARAVNITIGDKQAPDGSGTGLEDNEVSAGCVATQVWDLEAFWLNGNTLTMVGGYDFQDGQVGNNRLFRSGDIFIDDLSNGAAYYGTDIGGYTNTEVRNNLFYYDYVIDINETFTNYSVYALNDSSVLQTCYYSINTESNPWRYVRGGQAVAGYESPLPITFGQFSGPGAYGVAGWSGNDNHYIATGFDLGFLPAGTEFLAKYTYECGNDNMIGQGKTPPVPEPATLLLLGSGLIGLAGFRKKLKG